MQIMEPQLMYRRYTAVTADTHVCIIPAKVTKQRQHLYTADTDLAV